MIGKIRLRGVWIAAYHFATVPVRLRAIFLNGRMRSIEANGEKHMTYFRQPTVFRNLPEESVLLRVKNRAFLPFMTRPLRFVKMNAPSLKKRLTWACLLYTSDAADEEDS